MITNEQIQQNRERIRLKLQKEKDDRDETRERIETEDSKKEEVKEKKTDKLKEREEREDLAIKISEGIRGIITEEMKSVVNGIKELKINSPEIPEIKIPEITLPKIELPEITLPEIKLPEITVPEIETPVIPKIELPEIVLPEMPEIDTEKLSEAIREEIKIAFEKPIEVISVDREGKLNKSEVVRSGGSTMFKYLRNIADEVINPATEEQQVAMIAKELIGNSAVDGSGSTHHAVVDNAGRFHTRGFRDAAGNGRRMLVDADRHGQVDVLSLPDSKAYTTLIDDFTTTDLTYIGKAVAGSLEGGTVWQIKCLDETGNFLKIGFADGVSTFVKEWDNRVGYNYN